MEDDRQRGFGWWESRGEEVQTGRGRERETKRPAGAPAAL